MQTMVGQFFYVDSEGKKQGPVSKEEIKKMATLGVIKPDTQIEYADDGYNFKAGKHPDLKFSSGLSCCNRKTCRATTLPTEKNTGIFDIGFTRFISNTWISIFWVLLIIAHFSVAIGAMMFSFNAGSPVPLLIALFAAPISLLLFRMILELAVVCFRIESNIRESKNHLREIKELFARCKCVSRCKCATQRPTE